MRYMPKTNETATQPTPSAAVPVVITRETNIADFAYQYPDAAEVLMDYGLHCIGCFASAFDTIESGAKTHGMSDEEIDEMVERVNEVINFPES